LTREGRGAPCSLNSTPDAPDATGQLMEVVILLYLINEHASWLVKISNRTLSLTLTFPYPCPYPTPN
jgi:hypothetical protein